MEKLVATGKVKSIGVSNVSLAQNVFTSRLTRASNSTASATSSNSSPRCVLRYLSWTLTSIN